MASPTWSSTEQVARPATKRFHPSHWRSLEACCRPWTWWCNDATALAGYATPYLVSSFSCVADVPHRRRLRSASTEQLDVPTCRRSTIGGRAFPVAGAKLWNGPPSDVTSASSLPVFKNRHTCSAPATKLFDYELHFFFLVIISRPEQWSLQ